MMETLPSGTILSGRYRIERALGSGGFGHVYLGVELKTNQPFAIKEYLVTGSGGQAQLEHEARVLSGLHHPSLPAFQAAFSERGRYFVVLSYIEGDDLTDYIRITRQRNEVVPIARILDWMLAICDAVNFLHSQQPFVIHRDIKPDNIRITPEGAAVLVDLGNAKAVADGARTLFFIRHQGTPGYAPPEQYPGGSGTDVRSDVYALGGTLYFALTAQEPPSVSARNQSLQQGQRDLPSLQELVANNPPEQEAGANPARQFRLGVSKPAKPAPRHSRHLAQLGQLPPELLDKLNRIIKRAMALKPKERYQSVQDFSNDLRGVNATLPTSAPPRLSQPTNLYATQPDLPLLYESMQAAKENKEDEQTPPAAQPAAQPPPLKDVSSIPQAPPASVPPSAGLTNCPRCNTPLTPKAAFCPRCGLALSNTPPASSITRPPVEPSNNNPSVQNKASTRDISSDQTMAIIPPSAQAALKGAPGSSRPATAVTPDAMPFPNEKPRSSANPSRLVLPPVPNRENTPPLNAAPQSRANTYQAQHKVAANASSVSGLGMKSRIILLLAVVIVLVLIALVLLLFVVGQHPRPSGRNQGHSISAQVLVYERNYSLRLTSAATPAAARLRACRPGLTPSPGVAQRMAEAQPGHTSTLHRHWLA